MRDLKKKYAVYILCAGMLAVCLAGAVLLVRGRFTDSANLALQRGVIATSDSTENEELTAYKAIDGDDSTLSSRWSSENNWEDASHYIQLEFPTEISVSFVVLKWERRNVISYALEGSGDGVKWEVLQSFDTAPEMKDQEIVLQEAAAVRFLRLSIYQVSQRAEDYSDLYQNVSLYEFEVYADKPAAYELEQATIVCEKDGGRYLCMPEAPEGYEVTYLGADHEQVIGADGVVYDTIQEKEVTVGFRVSSRSDATDTREIAQVLTVPACTDAGTDGNACPDVIPALAEWQGGRGRLTFSGTLRIVVEEGSSLQDEAELLAEHLETVAGYVPQVVSGRVTDAQEGDIYLGYAEESCGLGREGYFCDITDKCVILALSDTGVRWGTVTLLQIIGQEHSLPKGKIRDYPLYEVRGFGIDVARKAVSMDTLYAMMEAMSYYKMNDLTVHLNDNVILSTSGLTDSLEDAMTADSAFRLESDVVNDKGEKLTSSQYAYTKEEFARFIDTAKSYGVTVVPEIDTPAHSLSITKLFPEYALTTRIESVDQIDLSKKEAVELVKTIWQEALVGEQAAFRNAEIVNIGMDEYYGDGEQYRVFLQEIAKLVLAEGKTVRLWGSLSNMGGTTVPEPDRLQMNLWSTDWADPREMYEAGYDLINMQNNHLYVIPGGGYDHLDTEELYCNWEAGKFYDHSLLEQIPVYSPQMLGASYMIWNDMCGRLDVGICEYDLYRRFEEPLPVLGAKLWGGKSEQSYETFIAAAECTMQNMYGREGGQNRLYEEDAGVEPGYEVVMRVKLADPKGQAAAGSGADRAESGKPGSGADRAESGKSDSGADRTESGKPGSGSGRDGRWEQEAGADAGQIIAESDCAYGRWAFYAAEPETGCVGFTREGRTYTWDYSLPIDEWVELKVIGEPDRTTLYVNGSKVGTLGNDRAFEEYATFVFPVERIGQATGRFEGEIEFEIKTY